MARKKARKKYVKIECTNNLGYIYAVDHMVAGKQHTSLYSSWDMATHVASLYQTEPRAVIFSTREPDQV